jgi:hypothetical protein
MDRRPRPKRKADSQDNERLSKRLSLLNLGMSESPPICSVFFYTCCSCFISVGARADHGVAERNGSKLYVPVENPSVDGSSSNTDGPAASRRRRVPAANDSMQVDDSKYKVYIYNLDDELSSSESEHEDGKLVFLPDIQRHLQANRIPPAVRPNSDGELAGMQLVLYKSAPSSLTVPEDRDSVRKAIIESRARFRDRQRDESDGTTTAATATRGTYGDYLSPGAPAGATVDLQTIDDPDAMDLS